MIYCHSVKIVENVEAFPAFGVVASDRKASERCKKIFNKNDAVVQCNRCDIENAMCVFTANYIVTGNFI